MPEINVNELEIVMPDEKRDRLKEIADRLAKIPPHFCTRGAVYGGTMHGNVRMKPEEAHNTVMDNNGRVIADSLNADYRITQLEDLGEGQWREVGTLAYFDVFANAPEDLRFLINEVEALGRFKAYVHRRLDDAGVPKDPDSPHKSEGCRIGGRLDCVFNTIEVLQDAAQFALAGLESNALTIPAEWAEKLRIAINVSVNGGEVPKAGGTL